MQRNTTNSPMKPTLIGIAAAIGFTALYFSAIAAGQPTSPGNSHQVKFDQGVIEDVYTSGTYLDVQLETSFEWAHITIVGPGQYELNKVIPSGSALSIDILHDPTEYMDPHNAPADVGLSGLKSDGTLPDGNYDYEITLHHGDGFSTKASGGFVIENGSALQPEPRDRGLRADEAQSNAYEPNLIERLAGTLLNVLTPSAQAQSVVADNFVQINTDEDLSRLNLMSDSGFVGADDWRIWNDSGFSPRFQIVEGLDTPRLTIRQGGRVGIGTAIPTARLQVEADSSENALRVRIDGLTKLFVQDNGGTTLGAVNSAPADGLRVSGDTQLDSNLSVDGTLTADDALISNGVAVFSNEVGIGAGVQLGTALFVRGQPDEIAFRVQPDGTNSTQFRVDANGGTSIGSNTEAPQRGLYVNGNVGVGTNSPDAPLHVSRSDNTAEIRLEDTGPGFRTMFRLVNNGDTNFRMENTAGETWQFTNTTNAFVITRSGDSPGPEMFIRNNGNMEIRGTLTENSSRTVKHGIKSLDGTDVLQRLNQLDISEWRYNSNPGSVHVGPMAEDWHELFGLGHNNKGVAPRDLAGIALAAAKALNQENKFLALENAELKKRLDRLELLIEDATTSF